jgi:16S rRNA (guanine(1405)-N(7))-methyltransferase
MTMEVAANGLENDLEVLVAVVLQSKKYQTIYPDLVRRIGHIELIKRQNLKDAIKGTKNKLHLITGAYLDNKPPYSSWTKELNSVIDARSGEITDVCLKILNFHNSTHERLPILDEFYSKIFQTISPVYSLLDIACGFNPIAIQWMPVFRSATYLAWDIYTDLVAFTNEFFRLVGQPGLAEVVDVLGIRMTPKVDVALLLKKIPCLENVDKLSGERLLDAIQARWIVVSFPVESLCGKEKGMRLNYENKFIKISDNRQWQVKRLEFSKELVFIIDKG